MKSRLSIASLSGAMDGGYIAIADVSRALHELGQLGRSRLIGGAAVALHQQRLGLDIPIRATGDADFGVPPVLLRESGLVAAIEAHGYRKIAGNRWERPIDDSRMATVDLLVPTYQTRARNTVKVGDVVTTEVPGLAEALRRTGHQVELDIALTDGDTVPATVVIPDAIALLALKVWARTVRNEDRDAEDLWRCLEIAHADGVTATMIDEVPGFDTVSRILAREFGPAGPATAAICRGLNDSQMAVRRTRIRALLSAVAGIHR